MPTRRCVTCRKAREKLKLLRFFKPKGDMGVKPLLRLSLSNSELCWDVYQTFQGRGFYACPEAYCLASPQVFSKGAVSPSGPMQKGSGLKAARAKKDRRARLSQGEVFEFLKNLREASAKEHSLLLKKGERGRNSRFEKELVKIFTDLDASTEKFLEGKAEELPRRGRHLKLKLRG